MAKGPDNRDKREPQLSAKARAIKKQIDEDRYDIDLEALADALLDAGALDVTPGLAADDVESIQAEVVSGLAQNDQKPRRD